MKKWSMLLAVVVAALVLAPGVFAQGASQAGGESRGLLGLAVGVGMGVAAFGCGLGQGRVAGSACEGIARNPGASGPIRAAMILGLVFIETLVLFTLAMIALKV